MKMILLGVSVLLMVPQYGITDPLSKHSNEVQYCSLTKSTLPLTKSSAFRASLREMVFSLKRLEDSLDPNRDSTSLQPQIQRVKVQTTDDLLELTCSTKPFSNDSQLPSSKSTQPSQSKNKILKQSGLDDDTFCKRLVDWADIIRKTFNDGGIDELISTRRLVHIVNAYKIFGSKEKAIEVCVNRFDEETKQSFMELYDKVDADVNFGDDEEPSNQELLDQINS